MPEVQQAEVTQILLSGEARSVWSFCVLQGVRCEESKVNESDCVCPEVATRE